MARPFAIVIFLTNNIYEDSFSNCFGFAMTHS